MGFASTDEGTEKEKERSVDDGAVGRKREGLVALGVGGAEAGRGLKRSATVGDTAFSRTIGEGEGKVTSGLTSAPATRSADGPAKPEARNKPGLDTYATTPSSPTKGDPSAKRPSIMFAPQVGPGLRHLAANTGGRNLTLADRGSKVFGSAPGIFGSGRGNIVVGSRALGRKVSKKTSLPSVMDSPVKGGGVRDLMDDDVEDGPSAAVNNGDVSMRSAADVQVVMNEDDDEKKQGKEKLKDAWKQNASMRASMASQSLTQSLSSIPRTPSKSSMGPPRTPGRAASSSYPSVASGSKDKREEEKRGKEEAAGGFRKCPKCTGTS